MESLRTALVKLLTICAALSLTVTSARAQTFGVVKAESASGQFTCRTVENQAVSLPNRNVAEVPLAGTSGFIVQPPGSLTNRDVKLVPSLLIVSCDRIKSALLRDLGMSDEWRGKIDLYINPSRFEVQGTLLAGIRTLDGWRFELQTPPELKSETLIRSVVQALLLEIADRSAGDQTAEIPLWLVEGLSAHLESFNLPTFVVQPHVELVANRFALPQQDAVRDEFRRHAPMTFQQLNLPLAENLEGDQYHLYSNCAQLFVEELLHFPDGARCLRQMLAELPRHLNWQTSFLLAFHSHFTDLRSVEKWWGLVCVDFTESDSPRRRTFGESWRKIQDALDVPVEVRVTPDRLPTPAAITLEEVITDWKSADAAPIIEHCMLNLYLLRPQLVPDLVPVVDAYRAALQEYLRSSQTAAPTLAYKKAVCKALRSLDDQREAMRKKIASAK
jgi:hypothetical protein